MVDDEQRRRAQWIGENRCTERKRLLMLRGFRAHGDEPVHNLRRARVIAYVLDHYPVVIDETDRLVGKCATEPLTDAEREELEAGGELLAGFQGRLRFGPGSGGVGGHRTIDFEKLLSAGVRGILEEVEAKARRAGRGKKAFYEACRTVLEALLRFSGRYRERLGRLRRTESDPTRRERLKRMAEALSRVPAEPPRNFREALQSAWFVQFAVGFDDVSCTGHPDRYLHPYYREGLETGSLTREEALRLIEELYLRSNEVYGDWPETIMVGGTDRDGRPVLNDLTRLFIEAVETVGLVNPNVALCYREDTPDDLLMLCLDKIGKGLSHPALYNDRVITEGLIEAGLTPEDARRYQNSTCVEITPVGCSNVQTVALTVHPVKALECLLNGGEPMVTDPRRGRRSADPPEGLRRMPLVDGGLRTELDELSSFGRFRDAFRRALANMTRHAAQAVIAEEDYRARHGSCPLVSCFTRDCVERGLDAAAGGARYNYCGANIAGFATAVDSLKTARTYRGVNFVNLPPTFNPGRAFGEPEPDCHGPAGFTVVSIRGREASLRYHKLVGRTFDYPETFPKFRPEDRPVWMKHDWELPAGNALSNGGFERGLRGWAKRFVYREDQRPSHVCTTDDEVAFAGERSLYLFGRKRGYYVPGDNRMAQTINNVRQAVRMPPGTHPIVRARYRLEGENYSPGDLAGACLRVDGYSGTTRRMRLCYWIGTGYFRPRGMWSDWERYYHFDITAPPGRWHAVEANVRRDFERAAAAEEDAQIRAFDRLDLDRLVVYLQVWNLNQELPVGSEPVPMRIGVHFDEVAVDFPEEPGPASSVAGRPIHLKPDEEIDSKWRIAPMEQQWPPY